MGLEFRSRANSAIPRGIAVLGRSDALAARGGAPRTSGPCFCGSPNRRPCRPGAERLGGVGDRPNLKECGDKRVVIWAELLRPFGSRSPPPRQAEGCNSSELVAALRWWRTAIGRERIARFFEPPALSPRRGAPRGGWATGRTRQNRGELLTELLRPFRVARAGRLPPGGPQHAARASRVAVPPGRPTRFAKEVVN